MPRMEVVNIIDRCAKIIKMPYRLIRKNIFCYSLRYFAMEVIYPVLFQLLSLLMFYAVDAYVLL